MPSSRNRYLRACSRATLALSPSFSLPLSAQSAAHRCEEQRQELVGAMCRALATEAPAGMKLVCQASDKQNEGSEVVGEGKAESEVEAGSKWRMSPAEDRRDVLRVASVATLSLERSSCRG
jgi:hypothetical protein